MPTVQALAGEMYRALESRTRDNGDSFVALKEGAPDWMQDAAMSAHGDFMPDDWRYEAIRDVCAAMSECDDPEECGQGAGELVDCYTGRLTAWLASNIMRVAYCDEAESEFGPSGGDMSARISAGQYMEYAEIWTALYCAFDSMATDDDDESEGDE